MVAMIFIIIGLILLIIFQQRDIIDTRKFIADTEPYLRFLMEDDCRIICLISV